MNMTPLTHDEIVEKCTDWLYSHYRCGFVLHDPYRTNTMEHPDVIGWREDVSILVEVKISRSDFLADAKKSFRRAPETGMGDWRIYATPPGLITNNELPSSWGLIEVSCRDITPRTSIPTIVSLHSDKPFEGNRHAENILLYSIVRRANQKQKLIA